MRMRKSRERQSGAGGKAISSIISRQPARARLQTLYRASGEQRPSRGLLTAVPRARTLKHFFFICIRTTRWNY